MIDTKITFIWRNPQNVPIKEMSLLVMTENNKLMTFKDSISYYSGDKSKPFSDWENMVKKYKIKYWVYQNLLIK